MDKIHADLESLVNPLRSLVSSQDDQEDHDQAQENGI
jgi:hypothetical protein